MTNYDILSTIDSIDDAILDSEMNVLESMIESYNKSIMILENYEGDNIDSFDIFNESMIIMESTSSKTVRKKSIIKQMINSLLRLIDKIVSFFKKKFGKKKNIQSVDTIPNPLPESTQSINLFDICDKALNEPDINKWAVTYNNEYFIDVGDIDKDTYIIYQNQGDKIIDYMSRVEIRLKDLDKMVDVTDNTTEEDVNKLKCIYNCINYFKSIINKSSDILKFINSINDETNVSDSVQKILAKYKRSKTLFVYSKQDDVPVAISNKLFTLGKTLRETNSYSIYEKCRIELFDMIGFPHDRIIDSGSLDPGHLNNDYFLLRLRSEAEDSYETTLPANTKLYHTSSTGGISVLRPSFKAQGSADCMYPSQRIYFFLNKPGLRTTTSNYGKIKVPNDCYVYEYNGPTPVKVKFDTEATHASYRKSVYIETTNMIPVKDVTDQFK